MSGYVHLAVAVKVHVHADDYDKVNENVGIRGSAASSEHPRSLNPLLAFFGGLAV